MADSPFHATHRAPASGLMVWNQPGTDRIAVGQVPAGADLQMLDAKGDWALTRAADGCTGWVDATGLAPIGGFRNSCVPPLIIAALLLILVLAGLLYFLGRMHLGQAPGS